MKLPSDSLPDYEAYYDANTRQYWIRNNRGGWVQVNRSALRSHLRMGGFNPQHIRDNSLVNELDEFVTNLHTEKDVAYAGPLAGYMSGIQTIANNRILVTDSPVFIKPLEGEWPLIHRLLENLFAETSEHRQLDTVYGWLKVAIESLYAGKIRPGQALVVAGEAGCGKSLFQTIVTQLLGGRYAKPFQFMMGTTAFNGDLFEAEHLMLEDEASTTDIRARRHFGSRIKDITVNALQRLHAKHRNAIRMKPFWRLTISLNDEPENLMVLPPLDDSLEDKVILLKARKRSMPMDTTTMEKREAFWSAMEAELPAFVHFLNQWQVPDDLLCERYGIRHMHHPEIMQALQELSPENRLLMLIDHILFNEQSGLEYWEGPATELESALKGNSKHGSEAKGLLHWSNACATFLGRLAKRVPERVVYKRSGGHRRWVIYRDGYSHSQDQCQFNC